MDSSLSLGYEVITKNLTELLQYIEPCDSNLGSYSHRTFHLLLSAATEFENLCKMALGDNGVTDATSITDYRQLEDIYHLSDTEVGLLFWVPGPFYIKPFLGWEGGKHSLDWYSDYNKVKHNRVSEFSKATFRNVVYAIAGLHLLFHEYIGVHFFRPYGGPGFFWQDPAPDGLEEQKVSNCPFSIRKKAGKFDEEKSKWMRGER